MATKFHFFTDANLLLAQTSSDAFGPAGTDDAGKEQYRISSMHSASSNPTAYAVCNGIVCAQDIPDTSPALVNLILKPLDRPPINFAPVRYYIYKGIRKDSLFDDAAIATSGTNQLTKAIWDSQNARNQSANTPNLPAPAEALGIDLTATLDAAKYGDSMPIDNLFYRTGVDAQFQTVNPGWTIGTFNKTRFGFEILLDGLGSYQGLALARSLENYISVAPPPTSGPEDVFAHWHKKEKVLGFIDPCAFYGSFYGNTIRARFSTGFEDKTGDPLYNKIVALFDNKNRAYLDIRNEHNNSFDYFNNYGRYIQVAFDATAALSSLDYYATGWPILIVEGTRFLANNPAHFNTLRVTLPLCDNNLPLLYIAQGYKSTGASPFRRELSFANKVIQMNLVSGAFNTDEVALAFPNVASTTNAHPVACYARLKYFRRIDSSQTVTPGSPATVIASNYLDNVFYPLELKTKLGENWHIKSAVYDEEIYVDARADLGIDFIAKVGFAVDDYNVTFFAFPLSVISGDENGKSKAFSITGEAFDPVELSDTYLSLLLSKFTSVGIDRSEIVLDAPAGNVNAISLLTETTTAGTFKSPNFAHFISLMVDKQTHQDLVARAEAPTTFLPGYRVFLGVKNGMTQPDDLGVDYTSNEIVLRGYVLNNGVVEVMEKNTDVASQFATNVKVYSR